MNRADTANLVVSIVNAAARRYNGLKSETPLAKEYLKLHGSASNLSTSTPGLNTDQLEKKYALLDKKFVALEQKYKDMNNQEGSELSERDFKVNRLENLIKQAEYRMTLCSSISEGYAQYNKIKERASELYFKTTLSDVKFNPIFEGIMKDFSELESRLKDIFEGVENGRKFEEQKPRELQVKVPEQEGQATFKLPRGGERVGAGRKKKEGMEARKISLSLPVDWWQHIDEMKEQHKMTQSDVLHNLIIPILAITSGGYNTDFIKSEGEVMTAIETYFKK
jgi:hypothetical protein